MELKIREKPEGKRVVLILAAGLIVFNTILYLVRLNIPVKADFEEINSAADTYTTSQGNYIVVCTDNGIKQFPFVFGGRLALVSVSDGKTYILKDNKHFLGGFADASLLGDRVYYFEAWDGIDQFLYCWDQKSRKEHLVLENVEEYAVNDGDIFYAKTDNSSILYVKNLKSDESKIIYKGNPQTGVIDYLSIKENVLYYSDTGEGALYAKNLETNKIIEYAISEKEDPDDWVCGVFPLEENRLLIATGKSGILLYDTKEFTKDKVATIGDISKAWNHQTYNLNCIDNSLYYYDKDYTVYKYNLSTKERQKLIDWSSIKVVKDYIDDIYNTSMYFSFSPDYIAAEVEYFDSETDSYDHRIVTFNYDGKLVLNKNIENLWP